MEAKWMSSGSELGSMIVELRSLLKRGLSLPELARARATVSLVDRIRGEEGLEPGPAARELRQLIVEAISLLPGAEADAVRALGGLDVSPSSLTDRRAIAAKALNVTPESFRKNRERRLLEQLAGALLAAGTRSSQLVPAEQRDVVRQYLSGVLVRARTLSVGLYDRRHAELGSMYIHPHLRYGDAAATEGVASLITDPPRRWLLMGEPGSGKTALCQYLASVLATSALENLDKHQVPLLVSMRQYARRASEDTLTLLEFISEECRLTYQLVPPPNFIDQLFESGSAFLILDGLDEIRADLVERLRPAIVQLGAMYPAASILATSRPVGVAPWGLEQADFRSVWLELFDEDQMAEYTRRWLVSQGVDSQPQKEGELLWGATSEILRRPLLLQIACEVYAGRLPGTQIQLLEAAIRMLGLTWDRSRRIGVSDLSDERTIMSITAEMARSLQDQDSPSPGLLSESSVLAAAERIGTEISHAGAPSPAAIAQLFLDYCGQRGWLFQVRQASAVGEPLYGFTHRLFEDYFLAHSLVRDPSTFGRLDEVLLDLERTGRSEAAQMAREMAARQYPRP